MSRSASAFQAINLFFLLFLVTCGIGQLDYKFYDNTCPNLTKIVRYGVWSAIANETRLAASLLRLHFHDCFVNVTILAHMVLSCRVSLTNRNVKKESSKNAFFLIFIIIYRSVWFLCLDLHFLTNSVQQFQYIVVECLLLLSSRINFYNLSSLNFSFGECRVVKDQSYWMIAATSRERRMHFLIGILHVVSKSLTQ